MIYYNPVMDQGSVVEVLREKVAEAGSITATADQFNLSQPMLTLILQGKRSVSGRILKALNLKKEIAFVPATEKKVTR
jgi:hypothetical protein